MRVLGQLVLGTHPALEVILSILGESRLQGRDEPHEKTGPNKRQCKSPGGSVDHGVPSPLATLPCLPRCALSVSQRGS